MNADNGKYERSGDKDSIETDETRKEYLTFKEKCINMLSDKDFVTKIVNNFKINSDLYDFLNLMTMLSTGEFDVENIIFQLLLERIRFQACSNTTSMRYRNVTKLFWSVVYRLCKGVGVKFFGGEKNWGQVVNKQSLKSHYDPNKSKLNFAVPDEKILREVSKVLPKIIPPGKIEATLQLLKGKENIIIMADGKLLTKGLKKDFSGDVDLFGHEEQPNLQDLRQYLEKQLEFIASTVENYADSPVEDKFTVVIEIVEIMTELIQKVRTFNLLERSKLNKYIGGNYPTKPDRAISSCKTNIYTSSIWMRKAININVKLFKFLANYQCNLHTFKTDNKLTLTECANVRILNNSEYVCSEICKDDSPHLVKKYSDEWKELVKESLVTDRTVADSLGLNGTKCMKKFFKNYIMDEGTDEYIDQIHPPDYELHCMATVSCLFMPALMPSCAILYEEGCSFYSGNIHSKLLSTSHTAVIR